MTTFILPANNSGTVDASLNFSLTNGIDHWNAEKIYMAFGANVIAEGVPAGWYAVKMTDSHHGTIDITDTPPDPPKDLGYPSKFGKGRSLADIAENVLKHNALYRRLTRSDTNTTT